MTPEIDLTALPPGAKPASDRRKDAAKHIIGAIRELEEAQWRLWVPERDVVAAAIATARAALAVIDQ